MTTMKKTIFYLSACLAALFIIQACGPSEAELQQREQARLDSLERVRMQRVEQARLDSLAMVQRQLEEQRRAEEERRTINFDENGPFTVQVGSWRSEEKAEELVALWKRRGFEGAYYSIYGTEETGDVWFRVRLGRVADRGEAEKLKALVAEDYNERGWIDSRP